ncbi:MAG: ABC transporter permease subunit [Pseudomonadota bacterium]
MTTLTIASRELRSLFLSPLAWSILGVVQLILAYLFLSRVDHFIALQPRIAVLDGAPGVTDLVAAPLFANAGVILLLVTPLLTMRLISEERRNATLSLLFTAPVSISEIILGKYLGVVAFLLIMVVMIVLMPLSLSASSPLDLGKLSACILALILLLASYAALGLYASCIASHPTVAAVSSLGALLLLWILDWPGSSPEGGSALFEYLSMLRHFETMLKGVVRSSDIAYFLLFILTFIILSIRRLDNDRLGT